LPELVVVATLAPRCFASWIANVPMPPAPAGMAAPGHFLSRHEPMNRKPEKET